MSGTIALLPVKQLSESKSRLAPILSDTKRKNLAIAMLKNTLLVLENARNKGLLQEIIVVSHDHQVLKLAELARAVPLEETITANTGSHLNAALSAANTYAVTRFDPQRLLVLPGDLPLLKTDTLEKFLYLHANVELLIAGDRFLDGTNALLLCPPFLLDNVFYYGPGSFKKFQEVAKKAGHCFSVYHEPILATDLDTPADFNYIRQNFPEVLAILQKL
jgi:2-phospho-L-lactate guanylyltransferase